MSANVTSLVVRAARVIALVGLVVVAGCARIDSSHSFRVAHGEISGFVDFSGSLAVPSPSLDEIEEHQGAILVYLQVLDSPHIDDGRTSNEEVVIRDGRQEPEIQLVRPGIPLKIRNLDSIYHDLFTLAHRNRFEIRLEGGQQSASFRLDHPGFVRFFCKLHPRESFAFIVADADRFVLLESGSQFKISNLPAGDYRIQAATVDYQSEGVVVPVLGEEPVDVTLRLLPRSL